MNKNLLVPRVKLYIPFPNMYAGHAAGDIFELCIIKEEEGLTGGAINDEVYFKNGSSFGYAKSEVNKCPEVFKDCPWYAERDIKDMPEYVKYEPTGQVLKVNKWRSQQCSVGFFESNDKIEGTHYSTHATFVLPATPEEYEAYKKSKV